MNYFGFNCMFVCKNPMAFRFLHIDLDSLAINNTNYVVFNLTAEFSVLETKLMQRACSTAVTGLFEKRKILYMYSLKGVLDVAYFESKRTISIKRLNMRQSLRRSRFI